MEALHNITEIIVDPDLVKNYHRGDIVNFELGDNDKAEKGRMRIISKYKLRSGQSRLKFEKISSEQIKKTPH